MIKTQIILHKVVNFNLCLFVRSELMTDLSKLMIKQLG